ncbi:MAG TPA: hypothetical protein VG963_05750, partial [Polyangiaceae bacterium]|nr:hypothetical protein [Polyangiaceae bacterium]
MYLCLAAFVSVLLAPFALRVFVQRSAPVVPSTSVSGHGAALELRIITPHNQDIRHVFEAAFSDWHSQQYGAPVNITYLSPGGT